MSDQKINKSESEKIEDLKNQIINYQIKHGFHSVWDLAFEQLLYTQSKLPNERRPKN